MLLLVDVTNFNRFYLIFDILTNLEILKSWFNLGAGCDIFVYSVTSYKQTLLKPLVGKIISLVRRDDGIEMFFFESKIMSKYDYR